MNFQIPSNVSFFFFNLLESAGQSPYLKMGIILIGFFIMILVLAFARQHIFKISMRGAVFGFFLGIFLVILLDLIVVFAFTDKAKMEKILSEGNRQEAVSQVMVSGMTNLGNVLGVSTIVSPKKPKTAQEVIGSFLTLPSEESRKVRDLLCPQ